MSNFILLIIVIFSQFHANDKFLRLLMCTCRSLTKSLHDSDKILNKTELNSSTDIKISAHLG